MMENILEMRQVSKTYPKSGFTLDKLSLSLPYGAIMGVVGEKRCFWPSVCLAESERSWG